MKSKRPNIKGIINSETQEIEKFQNQVLRPILKQQHQLLSVHFHMVLESHKINFLMQSPEVKNQLIDRMLSKNHTLRNIQIGMIVGMLSLEEFASYAKYQREYNRRMIQMLKKRFQDNL